MENKHIYIYGIIDSWQDNNASEWGYVNLKDVKNQIDKQGEFDELTVHIHSEGGVVTEGFAIHDYLRSLGKPITTVIDGVCASIATVILLSGDKRIGTENASPLIHNPWGMVGGDKSEIQKYADELETLEGQISEFYAKKTKLSKEEALELMSVETSFTADEALEKGFLTEIKSVMRAVALYNPKKPKMAKEELNKEDVQGMLDETWNKIKAALKIKTKPENKIVQDANGNEIDFPDVADDAQEVVGDKATIDGKSAEGEIVMPSGETYVFVAGELTEIKPKEEEGSEEMEALKQENEDLKQQLSEIKDEVVNLKDEVKNQKSKKKEYKNSLKEINNEVKEIKEALGSSFNYDPKKKNYKEKKEGTRRVLKAKEE